jgi:hypothetical protein
VLLLQDDYLLAAPIPETAVRSLVAPAHFLPVQGGRFRVGKTATLQLAAGGRTEGVAFSLLAEYPGVALDSRTGQITIDTQQLWDGFLERMKGTGGTPRSPSRSTPAALETAENARRYKELTAEDLPPNTFATELPIAAALQDPEGQRDVTLFSVIVLGPRKEVDEIAAAQEAERAQMLAARERSREEARAAQAAPQPQGSDAKRLDDLEARVRRIEVILDTILKRLDER